MKGIPKSKLILVGPYSLPHGGIQSYLVQLIDQLKANGYGYNVLDTRSKRDILYDSSPIKIFQRIFKYLSVLLRLIEVEGKIVHCFSSSYGNFYANGLVIVFGKIVGRKTVISMLGGGWPSVVQNSGKLKKLIIKSIFRFADGIIACNEQIEENIISLAISKHKITLVSNALPIKVDMNEPLSSEIQSFFDSHHPVITSVSALLPEYGVTTLIKALVQLRAEFHDIGLILIVLATSENRTSQEIDSIIDKDELSQNLIIVKNVDSASAVIQKSDLFVRPNLLDGDSVSVREALFLGIPVVASDTAFRPQDVVLFKRGDVNDLYTKIKKVIEDPQSFLPRYASIEALNNLHKIKTIYRQISTFT